MFGILLILFTVVPALEFYLLFNIGSQIGAGNTFAIIIITGIVGASLAKSEGLQIFTRVQQELNSGQMPANQIIQGFLVFGGGLLLLTPGFLTDIFGLCMVIPGPRHLIMAVAERWIANAIKSGNIQVFTSSARSTHQQQERPPQQNKTIEAEFRRED